MAITDTQKEILNRMNRRAAKVELGTIIQNLELGVVAAGSISTAELADDAVTADKIADDAVGSAQIADDAVDSAQIADSAVDSDRIAANAVTLAKVEAGKSLGIAADDAKTTSREENVAGLSSAITLANSLKTVMNAHAADAAEHTGAEGADDVNFPVTTADASDLATLLALSGDLLTAYDEHDADAEAVTPDFHAATEAGDHSLTSAVTPTTLQEAVTRLNDLKAKFNAHDADSTAHDTGSQHQESTADAAYGAAILVSKSGVASGDLVVWGILDSGTGTVTGVSAVAGTDSITFTFSDDPQNDAIISYAVLRAAS